MLIGLFANYHFRHLPLAALAPWDLNSFITNATPEKAKITPNKAGKRKEKKRKQKKKKKKKKIENERKKEISTISHGTIKKNSHELPILNSLQLLCH